MSDALDKLIIDEDQTLYVDTLAELVGKYLRFTKTGEIIFEKEFHSLKDWQKILVYLLGRKVISSKKLREDFNEEASPKEIQDALGTPAKSISKYFSVELKGIVRSDKGASKIPNFNLHKCSSLLNKRQ